MSTATQNPPVETPSTPVIVKLGVFPGALGRFQVAAFGDLQKIGFTRQVSHLIAADFGGDLGNLMKTDPDVAAKVGKAMKGGEAKITLSGSGKVVTTRSMSAVRAAQVILQLKKENIIEKATVIKWADAATNSMTDYIAVKELQASKLKFED